MGIFFAGTLEALLGSDMKIYQSISAEIISKVTVTPLPADKAYLTDNLSSVN